MLVYQQIVHLVVESILYKDLYWTQTVDHYRQNRSYLCIHANNLKEREHFIWYNHIVAQFVSQLSNSKNLTKNFNYMYKIVEVYV